MSNEPDYVTILPTETPSRYLVVVMKWHARDEEYVQGRVSASLRETAAKALAEIWAAALGVEVR